MSDEPLPNSEIILYQTADGRTRVQCRFEDETLWLTQVQIAELFQTTVPNIMVKRILNRHGYPPDLAEEAVKTVLQQAELLCADWV